MLSQTLLPCIEEVNERSRECYSPASRSQWEYYS
jgi:hypothetical protein